MNSLEKPQVLVFTETIEEDYTFFDIKWIPTSARFVVIGCHTKGTGSIRVYSFVGRELKLSSKNDGDDTFSYKCGTFKSSDLSNRNLTTGDFKGNIHIWDLENLSTPKDSFKSAHSDLINSIDGSQRSGEILTASRDGSVKVWDVRVREKPVAVMIPRETEYKRDCWTASFGQDGSLIAAGYDNGDIKIFDLKAMSVLSEPHLNNGVCSVEFDRSETEPANKLIATCLQGKIHAFDLRTLHPKKGYAQTFEKFTGSNHTTLWGVRHLPQNRDIFGVISGSGSLGLYQYQYPDKRSDLDNNNVPQGVPGTIVELQETTISDQPVNALDWSKDKLGLAVCTAFDKKIRIVIATKLNII
ncbi:dynein axonemal assembly factor 10 [Lepeophtheirus salmonis]|uniref:WD repeat-containing protein 92 n=1 Tax=Lepeophtheirus salmonis TaxID=72036 RepID=C1BU57_LEPSM|nr:WD repeat-containing protein 92-like [Lepeophtheirus salmonis]ACO12560.1 WD repeat-containing protein 92 [Lepeophtheirus salmonis]ADD38712.1 WD repeat-containing protein 92 [Lepeophtheirus salmonis]